MHKKFFKFNGIKACFSRCKDNHIDILQHGSCGSNAKLNRSEYNPEYDKGTIMLYQLLIEQNVSILDIMLEPQQGSISVMSPEKRSYRDTFVFPYLPKSNNMLDFIKDLHEANCYSSSRYTNNRKRGSTKKTVRFCLDKELNIPESLISQFDEQVERVSSNIRDIDDINGYAENTDEASSEPKIDQVQDLQHNKPYQTRAESLVKELWLTDPLKVLDAAIKWHEQLSDNVARVELRRVAKASSRDQHCALSGYSYYQYAHIKAWSICETQDQRLDLSNIIFLSPNLHAAFDQHEFGIRPDAELGIGHIELSSKLAPTRKRELDDEIKRWAINIREFNVEYLNVKYAEFQRQLA